MNQRAIANHEDSQREATPLVPRVDVSEDATGITVLADLPGVSRDGLHVRVDNDSLTIEGEIQPDLPEGLEPVYAEVQVARYKRVFTLSRELDSGAISASLKDGVLNLRIPKQAHAQPRRIEVKVG
ncbi:Hsp20/alpha crystallin family protein [Cupriavidus sp. AU9028]|uniref:Hsp20/alpha crystallin family protein n=1 Tax=Cupriavidus sp. AU9028 TaxID=2871157 RepID=UPI001C947799|nr:Hsp20/alpha crystallin family protein [Cupriavidus sp. AU9028]MBY4896671.1 Hsp20/alpha crystallin family protein [Cupriavidus sp. AU9028]